MALPASPGQNHVEAIAGVQLMDAAQRLQRPVVANMEIEVVPTPCLHRQAARGCVR